jgi:hypothetical protein
MIKTKLTAAAALAGTFIARSKVATKLAGTMAAAVAMRKIIVLVVLVAMFCVGCSIGSIEKLIEGSPPTVTVVVSPMAQTLVVSTQQQFTAKLTGTSNQVVEWSIGGTACTETTECGTITANGLFTAPGSVPSPAEITITATAKANTKDSGAAVVTVTIAPVTPAMLRGAYTFLLKGFDVEGPFSMGGSFVADGAGHLQHGELRECREETHCADQIFAGTTSARTKDTGIFEVDILPGTTFTYMAGTSGALNLKILGTLGLRAEGILTANSE